jgi:uncharacterized protein YfbU (UPF0304 family)
MATITLRLDDATRDAVNDLAQHEGVSISELLRSALADLVAAGTTRDAPRTLTTVERRTLALQHEVLAQLRVDDDEVAHHTKMVEVLTHGYTGEYNTEFAGIYPELPLQDCSLVWRLLDMFVVLKSSLERLSAKDRAELGDSAARALTFRGFDFNDAREVRLGGYAQFLIEDRKWVDLAEHFDDQHEGGNSHMPALALYRRMLSAFTPLWKARMDDSSLGFPERYSLTLSDLQAVHAACSAART